CRKIRETPHLKDLLFLLVTAKSERENRLRGFESGVDDYLVKPLDPGQFLGRIRSFIRIKTLQNQIEKDKKTLAKLNCALKQDFNDLLNLLIRLIDIHIPGAKSRAERMANAGKYVCQRLKVSKADEEVIYNAILLHEVGKVNLPSQLKEKKLCDLKEEDKSIYRQYPLLGHFLLKDINALSDEIKLIKHQLENVDGSGFPDHLTSIDIPLGSKIMRTLIEFEEIAHNVSDMSRVLSELEKQTEKSCDSLIFQLFQEYFEIGNEIYKKRLKELVPFYKLKPGMKLAYDIFSKTGNKLLQANTVLTEEIINKILQFNERDPILEEVYIYVA
ncbi:MAG: HD domain-containing phosphohydrolase, partial [Thermodesulfobacteriota bacterium]|nr:HD domain-containing phosphohydrolase [Thermodesulfobacteriota bacterium]